MKIKKKGQSIQELIGIKSFTNYGLATKSGELLFFQIAPTNISVLSKVNIEIKIRHLMTVLSAITECVKAEVDLGLKDRVEDILKSVGLTPQQAISIFYKQIALKNGIPFKITESGQIEEVE